MFHLTHKLTVLSRKFNTSRYRSISMKIDYFICSDCKSNRRLCGMCVIYAQHEYNSTTKEVVFMIYIQAFWRGIIIVNESNRLNDNKHWLGYILLSSIENNNIICELFFFMLWIHSSYTLSNKITFKIILFIKLVSI